MRLCFADCELDTEARQLRCGGQPRPLSPKALQLLELLIEARPRALSRRYLHDRLWPDTFVGPTSLARIVTEVRAAVGDARRQQDVVRTVHGYGYAFAAEVTAGQPPPMAVPAAAGSLLWSGHVFPLAAGRSVIGRGPDCTVRLPVPGVSRHHACIRIEGGPAVIEDLGSKNGTFVAERRVTVPTVLADGDAIRLGLAELVYCAPEGTESTETTAPTPRRP